MSAYLYVLRCADGSYYVGTTVGSLEKRVAEHQTGAFDGYTAPRRPVALVFHQHFDRLDDAAAAERQVKGWRREKKEALIRATLRLYRSWRGAGRRCVLRDAAQAPLLRMTKVLKFHDKGAADTPDNYVPLPLPE